MVDEGFGRLEVGRILLKSLEEVLMESAAQRLDRTESLLGILLVNGYGDASQEMCWLGTSDHKASEKTKKSTWVEWCPSYQTIANCFRTCHPEHIVPLHFRQSLQRKRSLLRSLRHRSQAAPLLSGSRWQTSHNQELPSPCWENNWDMTQWRDSN